nr:MAG TPA: ParB protein [Bacteriophage sp.]
MIVINDLLDSAYLYPDRSASDSMEMIMKKIEVLHPYENNPRKNEGAIDAVANSIKEFGFKVPIVIDKKDTIVTGHTRFLAAQKLGLEEVPCILADDLTPKQIRAFRLADNKTSELAGWDFAKLDEELALIDDLDMTDFGFIDHEDIDVDSFFASAEEKPKEPRQIQCPHCGEWFDL